jgi:hypothetical protein
MFGLAIFASSMLINNVEIYFVLCFTLLCFLHRWLYFVKVFSLLHYRGRSISLVYIHSAP